MSENDPRTPTATVVGVSLDGTHRFSKTAVREIVLKEGWGVEGDAHAGITVQHRSRVARDPSQPNLRQVHLLHAELFDEVDAAGYAVSPGELGENVTTQGLDLLGLPAGTLLRLGDTAVVEVTGLRNPCVQINGFEQGLLGELVGHDADGALVRKAGVMGVVRAGGRLKPGDGIRVDLPSGERMPLQPV